METNTESKSKTEPNHFNSPCKDLTGNISFADMFRPVNSDAKITDVYGYVWKQETAGGWRRIVDSFFIPMGQYGVYYNHKHHSVEAQENI